MSILPTICWEFFKTGLFAIGGGLATLPFLYHMAEIYPWFSLQELTNMIAVAESTPGPIGVNMATYAGFAAAEFPGALLATLSLVFPSIVIIIVVSKFLDRFRGNRAVNDVFYGIRPAVAGLIAAAGFQVALLSLLDMKAFEASRCLTDAVLWPAIGLFAVLLILSLKTKWHPIATIGIGAAAGMIFGL